MIQKLREYFIPMIAAAVTAIDRRHGSDMHHSCW